MTSAEPAPAGSASSRAPSYELREVGGLDVLAWPVFDDLDVTVIVTTRSGGVSRGPYASLNLGLHVGDDAAAVLENRRRAAAAVGLRPTDLVFCNQAHGRSVHRVGPADRGRGALALADAIDRTDALVTDQPGVGLVVMVADCVPIVLYDPVAHVLATVHAGWRGTVARVVEAAVAEMTALGAEPARLIAAVGPAIPADRYQVGDDVVAAARECFGERADDLVRPDGTGRWLFDTWGANRIVLADAGVPAGSVHMADLPTSGDGPFYSDRAVRPCGRFAAIAVLRGR